MGLILAKESAIFHQVPQGGGSMTPKWETRMQSLEAWGTSGLKNQVEQLMNETEKISRTPKVFIKIFLCT